MPYHKVPHWTPDNGLEVLTFGLGGETFALEAGIVREILDMMPVTMVPGADALAASVINFRGRIVPLADLRGSFGMEAHAATADSRIIVIELDMDGAPILIGLTADRVDEVTVLHAGDAEEAPVIGMRWPREHVRCLVRRGGDVVVLPDLAALFSRLTARGGEPVSVH
ncbi:MULTISPECIES: chemotaxis protein CheW [Sphingomonas]|jgi:purine-binding chemotaxis protein CheW|uniref:Chemotaxis protein CheW n=1 Tax=Sphingomonas zeae TaxID=1646122 RepID=A0A7Y6EFK7_9SPHN|nr:MULTISPECIES: chemotaxis protein CheW [Sphingomonas]MBB4050060.1 purine-binding chemotaxis protein CheW [Sphingomonas zeae]MDK8185048.1 chemotaxis protein CheW [Sphingomonas zeae]MDK8215841.1 chemotaxis protein CheW [Sphingomonas sp. UMB7805-LC452B]NUU45485.1 chemotaxis protein CheW [Sphingomonas zeae]